MRADVASSGMFDETLQMGEMLGIGLMVYGLIGMFGVSHALLEVVG